jgi:hypothetical protein
VRLSRLFLFLLVDHFMKVGGRPFDIEMLILAGAAFGGNNCATVNVPEIAVRKLVSHPWCFHPSRCLSQDAILQTRETVLTNERLMFAASVSFVPGKVAFLNEFLGVVKIDFV